ncbi:TauD/TfdA family dioxygenase [Salipiger sp.]|uniref:TauD/TfdA family dioxygenase n=1 Tax=Salipiger sp. TaxID=2078585 RepID=UPI003A97964D
MPDARPIPPTDPDARRWSRDSLDPAPLRYTLTVAALDEIDTALRFARENGLTVDTIEQEDFRLPSFARDVAELRARLDKGAGFVVIGGIPEGRYDEAESEIVAWALCNYLGQIIRQGIGQDRRFFTVSDKGMPGGDPTRIGASPKRSPKHSDNGCLEPRSPGYLALYCVRSAAEGGESTLISARTIHDTVARERPDLLPLLFETYHFRAPQAHVWPSKGPTVQMPILEVKGGELRVHYARVMVEPGMEMAGTPLSATQREALDLLDDVLDRPELNHRFTLQPGEMLVLNNLVLLHGREAFAAGSGGRTLKRFWMWRRHIGPGTDPAALDMEEFA